MQLISDHLLMLCIQKRLLKVRSNSQNESYIRFSLTVMGAQMQKELGNLLEAFDCCREGLQLQKCIQVTSNAASWAIPIHIISHTVCSTLCSLVL